MKGSDGDDDAGGKTKRETEFLETVNNTSAEAKMAADWVEDCIESGSTLTVPTPNFGEQPMLAMQFLNVQKKKTSFSHLFEGTHHDNTFGMCSHFQFISWMSFPVLYHILMCFPSATLKHLIL